MYTWLLIAERSSVVLALYYYSMMPDYDIPSYTVLEATVCMPTRVPKLTLAQPGSVNILSRQLPQLPRATRQLCPGTVQDL